MGGGVFWGSLGLGFSTDGKTKGPEITLAKLGKAVSNFIRMLGVYGFGIMALGFRDSEFGDLGFGGFGVWDLGMLGLGFRVQGEEWGFSIGIQGLA